MQSTEFADSVAAIAWIIPLALVSAARAGLAALARSGRDARYELALAGGALAAAASCALRAVTAAGGFTVRPLSIFGAAATGPPASQVAFFLLPHLAVVALAAAGAWLAARFSVRQGES